MPVEIFENKQSSIVIKSTELSLKEKWKSRPNIRIRPSINSSISYVQCENNLLSQPRREEMKDFAEISVHEDSSSVVIIETVKDDLSFTCIHCGFKSLNEDSHTKHLKMHSSTDFFECERCSFTCNNTNSLRSHKSECRSVPKNSSEEIPIIINEHVFEPLQCEECGIAFSSKIALNQHKGCHSPLRPFACDKCNYRFLTKRSLHLHQSHHEKIKHLECPHCNFRCNLSRKMIIHSRIHSNEKPFQCNDCNYSCTNASNLKLHQSCHSKEKIFPCEDCNFSTHRKSLLISHAKVHSSYCDYTYFCQICDIKFKRARSLQYHMQKYHIKQELLECPFCDFSQRNKILLKIHIRRHTGEKPYKCSFPGCSFKGVRSTELKNHILKQHLNDL